MNYQETAEEAGIPSGFGLLLDSEEDPARLWAEIHRLRAAVAGPQGYATWQDAATAERVRRVKASVAMEEAAKVIEELCRCYGPPTPDATLARLRPDA